MEDPVVKLTTLEINQKNLMEQLENMNLANKEQHTLITKSLEKLETKLDRALETKAGVWVEKAIIGAIVFILTGLASYVGILIYNGIIHLGK